MKIYEYSENISTDFSAAVIALGLFDGVHKGHRALLSAAKKEAEKLNLPLAVFTFFSESELPKSASRLYSTSVKNELLEKEGVDCVIYSDFKRISNVTAEDFVNDILIKKLKLQLAVTGFDFKFGKGRAGDTKLLSQLVESAGKKCLLIPDEIFSGNKVSTSLIKELLSQGRMNFANELLGEPYFIEGEIIKGDGRGKMLGLPTVNISLQNKPFLKLGVYRSEVLIGEKSYTGLTNIGNCPTFEEREVHAETFILGFDEKVYGKTARISLLDFLREEKKFNTKDELINQVKKDINSVKEKL